MFIKKDLRKIEEILNDPEDTRERMLLPKRSSELRGNVKVLCKESNAKKIANLRMLNLYENDLTSLKGIGILANTPIEDLNLGYNKLASIPVEFGSLSTLKTLWLDDNQLDQFPICLCSITGLEMLRLTGNQLRSIPHSICALEELKTLALDNNNIFEFPEGCIKLPKLEHLWLRQNKLRHIPDIVDQMSLLKTLSVSSNLLQALPESLTRMPSLENLYVNGNQISEVSAALCLLPNLKELNLGNNVITRFPAEWSEVWGVIDVKLGIYMGLDIAMEDIRQQSTATCKVTVLGNPL